MFVVIFFKTMYNKTILLLLDLVFNILNHQGLGKCYQARLITLIKLTFYLDYSGYLKNLMQ